MPGHLLSPRRGCSNEPGLGRGPATNPVLRGRDTRADTSHSMGATPVIHLVIAFFGAFIAGAINSVAGGGTMISFPILLALGLPPVTANATNTVGIWPGSLGSVWGFRKEMGRIPRRMRWLLVPAVIGGGMGALLLRITPASLFERSVPWLILFATGLFTIQGPVQKFLKSAQASSRGSLGWFTLALLSQLLVGIYGGYFGAGMSIMMLSILALIGMTDRLEMSAMTSCLALGINGTAGLLFILAGIIHWPVALAMAIGSCLGGYGAAGIARKIGKVAIRRFVIAVGFTLAAVIFVKLSLGK